MFYWREENPTTERLWNWSPSPCSPDSSSCKAASQFKKNQLKGRAVIGVGLTLAVVAAIAAIALAVLSFVAPHLLPFGATIALWGISSASFVLGITLIGIGSLVSHERKNPCECGPKPLAAAKKQSDRAIAKARKAGNASFEKIEALPPESRVEERKRVEKKYKAALESLKSERSAVLSRLS